MEFKTTFIGGDFAAFYRMRDNLLTKSSIGGRIVVAATGAVEIALGGVLLPTAASGIGGMLIAVGILFLAMGIFYYPILGWRSSRAMPKDVGEIGYCFGDSSFTQSQRRGSASVEYDRVFSAAESREVIALFYDETHGVFFPKRSVPDVEELRILLEEKLGFPLRTFNF